MNKKIILSGNCLTIVVNGTVYTNTNASAQDYFKAQTLETEDEIKHYMMPELFAQQQKVEKEREYVESIRSGFDSLVATGEFRVDGDSVYMVGIDRTLPELLIRKFVEVANLFCSSGTYSISEISELSADYDSLKRFWKKCCLCPNAQSAEDLYRFLEKHNMKITKNGNFLAYRRVVSREDVNKPLIEFVANNYTKLRARHKATGAFDVWEATGDENKLVLTMAGSGPSDVSHTYNKVGNLKDLYLDLPALQQGGYTDARTGKFDYRIGEIASMPRDKGDDSNRVSCSTGLHAASKEYDYRGFGDVDILVIISPHQVLAVPQGEDGKLRTSAFYFACTLSEDERFILDEEDFDVTELDDDFEEKLMFNLEEEVKKGFAEEVKRHTFSLPQTTGTELSNIINDLKGLSDIVKGRVVSFGSDFDLDEDDYEWAWPQGGGGRV